MATTAINMCMRLHELFEEYEPIIVEVGGAGRIIPGVNTTPDVGPGEIIKQSKKFGFKVSRDGVPPSIRSNGKIN